MKVKILVKTAGKLIRAGIKAQEFDTGEYPSKQDIERHQESLILLLRLFMETLTSDDPPLDKQ